MFVILYTVILTVVACCRCSAAQVPDSLSPSDAESLRLILTEEESKEFGKHGSSRAKARWAKIYWKRRDPTPTTEKNERLQEHLRRVAHSRRFYTAFTLAGYDERGQIYVKYGEPTMKYTEPVGASFARANESWSYTHIHPGLIFDFISDGTSYHLTDDFSRAVTARSSIEDEISNLISLYQSRSHLDTRYAKTANALTHVLNVARDDNERMNLAQEQLAEFASEAHRSKIEAPVASYEYDYQKKPLHFITRSARFRGSNGKVRLEFYYGIPINELKFHQKDLFWATPLDGKAAIFDSLYNTVMADSFTVDLRVLNEAATHQGVYNNQLNFLLPPGEYHAALQAENVPGNRLGILQADITCPTFSPDTLAISDLQLSHQIVAPEDSGNMKTASRDVNDKYVKHGLRIAPLAGQIVPKKRMLFVYFEIYGLQRNENGLTRYELQYALKALRRRKNLLGKIFGIFGGKKDQITVTTIRDGQSPDPMEHLGIDLSQQSDGEFSLEVIVRDLNGREEVRSRVPIMLN